MLRSIANVRLCCWNILADAYAHRQLRSSPITISPIEEWNHRFSLIKSYIIQSSADILCLQEVDHFEDSFKPFLTLNNYECIYYQRKERKDGCLIAYKPALFTLNKVDFIEFDDIADIVGASYAKKNYIKRNVGIIAHFTCKNTEVQSSLQSLVRVASDFIVSNCHIYWNPHKPEVKLAQVQYYLDRLIAFIKKNNLLYTTTSTYSNSNTSNTHSVQCIPIIAAGDYNSLPTSDLTQYLTDNKGFAYSRAQSLLSTKHYSPSTKFLCDHSLSRLCRWMRILGLVAHIMYIYYVLTRLYMYLHVYLLIIYNKVCNKAYYSYYYLPTTACHSYYLLSYHCTGIDTAIQSTDGSKNYVDTLKEEIQGLLTPSTTSDILLTTADNTDITKDADSTINELTITTTTSATSAPIESSTDPTTTASEATQPLVPPSTPTNYQPKYSKASLYDAMFKRAKDEGRIILTTSKQMIERANCPPSLLVPSGKLNNLELVLAEICRTFSLTLNPNQFLTVCGKCGGEITECNVNDIIERDRSLDAMSQNSDSSLIGRKIRFLPRDRPVYACVECFQVGILPLVSPLFPLISRLISVYLPLNFLLI